jgi:hypothetical protein
VCFSLSVVPPGVLIAMFRATIETAQGSSN